VLTEIKITDGYKLNNGWVSPLFVNNKEKQITEFIDPLILLYDKRIIHSTQVQRALELCIQEQKPVLIICEDLDEEGLAFLAMNNIQKRIRCCVVKSPSFGNTRMEDMEDIALLTGGTYISDSRGVNIKEIELANFGRAKKVIVTKDETLIIGGDSDKESVDNLLNELRMNLAQAKNEDEQYPIEKRIAKITGGVAVIHVGAATETEMKEKLDRVDDSVRATKAAIAEGYIVGSGTALLRIFKNAPNDGKLTDGEVLLYNVLDTPLRQICKNAGVDDNEIFKSVYALKGDMGYNAKTGQLEDLDKSGIIDPAKVVRCALQNAASSATMILTSEVLIVDTL